uniref:Guanylate-binding protein N-terminal domain-containing protein n=1 Tax=Palpitomonas bilix TaxID=652834 RepID=A0A7S3D7U7_9EUKA
MVAFLLCFVLAFLTPHLSIEAKTAVKSAVKNECEGYPSPLPLIQYDDSTEEFKVPDQAAEFFSRLESKVALVIFAGVGKAGKSTLINNMLAVPHECGMTVSTSFKPGTRGVWIWPTPIQTSPDAVVLVGDTEGLGAPGAGEDFDAKLSTITTLLSSVYIYTVRGQVSHRDVTQLQSVTVMAEFFEKKFKKSLPLPALAWAILSTNFKAPDSSHEYIEWVLQEKSDETEENAKYNEVVRVLKKYKNVASIDPVTFFRRPHSQLDTVELATTPYSSLDSKYREEVEKFKSDLLAANIKPKPIFGEALSGKRFLQLAKDLCLEASILGGTTESPILRFVAKQAAAECESGYFTAMAQADTTNIALLHRTHKSAMNEAKVCFFEKAFGGEKNKENRVQWDLTEGALSSNFSVKAVEANHSVVSNCRHSLAENIDRMYERKFTVAAELAHFVRLIKAEFYAECKASIHDKAGVLQEREREIDQHLLSVKLREGRESKSRYEKRIVFTLVFAYALNFVVQKGLGFNTGLVFLYKLCGVMYLSFSFIASHDEYLVKFLDIFQSLSDVASPFIAAVSSLLHPYIRHDPFLVGAFEYLYVPIFSCMAVMALNVVLSVLRWCCCRK